MVSLTRPQLWLKNWLTRSSSPFWFSSTPSSEKPLRRIKICFVSAITSWTVSVKPLPGSLDFVQCVDGKDTIIQDYTKIDGWQNAEVMDIVAQIEQSITTRVVPPVPAVNYHITDDHIGEGGVHLL